MSEKIAKLKYKKNGIVETIYPVTHIDAVVGLENLELDNYVTKAWVTSNTRSNTWFPSYDQVTGLQGQLNNKANNNEVVKLTTSQYTIQEIDSRIDISHSSIPFYLTRKTTAGGTGLYAAAVITRDMTTGTPDNNGAGLYFRSTNSERELIDAGVIGGRLTVATKGATVGEVVLAPAWNGADPYNRSDFRVRARSASIADAYINGKFYSENTKEVATQDWVASNTRSSSWVPTAGEISDMGTIGKKVSEPSTFDFDSFDIPSGIYAFSNSHPNNPPTGRYGTIIQTQYRVGQGNRYGTQIAFHDESDRMFIRSTGSSGNRPWKEIANQTWVTSNTRSSSWTPTWDQVRDKPTFAPSNAQKNSDITQTEIEAKLTGSVGTHYHHYLAQDDLQTDLGSHKLAWQQYSDTTSPDGGAWHHALRMQHGGYPVNGYYRELLMPFHSNSLYISKVENGAKTITKLASEDWVQGQLDGKANLTGATFTGQIKLNYQGALAYNNVGLELREREQVLHNQSSEYYAPAIGFHWGNRHGNILLMDSSGILRYGSAGSSQAIVLDNDSRLTNSRVASSVNLSSITTKDINTKDGDSLYVKYNNKEIKIRIESNSWASFYTNLDKWYFDKNVYIKGDVYTGTSYNKKLATEEYVATSMDKVLKEGSWNSSTKTLVLEVI